MDNRVWSHQSSRNPVITTLRVTQLRATRAAWPVMSVLIKKGGKSNPVRSALFSSKRCVNTAVSSAGPRSGFGLAAWQCNTIPPILSLPSPPRYLSSSTRHGALCRRACTRGYILRFSAGTPSQHISGGISSIGPGTVAPWQVVTTVSAAILAARSARCVCTLYLSLFRALSVKTQGSVNGLVGRRKGSGPVLVAARAPIGFQSRRAQHADFVLGKGPRVLRRELGKARCC